jgi:hypothetical protein
MEELGEVPKYVRYDFLITFLGLFYTVLDGIFLMLIK